jgi:hypothetical protein
MCRPVSPQNLHSRFKAKTRNSSTDGFEAQTIKPPTSSVLHTRSPQLDVCHLRPRPPGHQVFESLRSTCTSTVLTRSTQSLLHVHLCLLMSPKCQPPRLITWPPGPSVQASRPSFTATGPSAWHVPTWPSAHHRPPPPSSTPTHHKPRDMLHNPTHAMVSSQTQPKTQITLTISHHKSGPQGHISTLCLQYPPWWVHCQHQHTKAKRKKKKKKKKKKKRKTENSPKWPKAKENVKLGHLKWAESKTWSPKTCTTAQRNQEKHSLPSRRGNGLNTTSKAQKCLKTARPSRRGKGSTHLTKANPMQLSLNKCNLPNECMHSTRWMYKLSPWSCVIYLSPLLTHAHIKP